MSYACSGCGYETARWMGFCPQCRTHGSLSPGRGERSGPAPVAIAEAAGAGSAPRTAVGIGEVDRVLGGGLVEGSAVLVGGEPGVGKSTLLLQVAARLATAGRPVLYVSGEESPAQIGSRAARTGAVADELHVLAETDVGAIEDVAAAMRPALVVVDSVQTMRVAEEDGAPGGVNQVRGSGARFTAMARRLGTPVLLVGHVTKDGAVAGPKVLEHLVDVVLYVEGDPERGLRYLRGLKNRHGSVSQVGVFEMTNVGMVEVADPTGLFVGGWTGQVPGTVVFPAMYGRRSLLLEIQALVSPSTAAQPRRSVKGVETARVHQILAVLEKHAGVKTSDQEVYVNVVGGLTLRDPAADLAVALAVASSCRGMPLGSMAAFGEIGLAGEVRAVAHRERRVEEAERFGISRVMVGGRVDRITRAVHLMDSAGTGPGRCLEPVEVGVG